MRPYFNKIRHKILTYYYMHILVQGSLSSENYTLNWNNLPDDILHIIFEYLPLRDRLHYLLCKKTIQERTSELKENMNSIPLFFYKNLVRNYASRVLHTLIMYNLVNDSVGISNYDVLMQPKSVTEMHELKRLSITIIENALYYFPNMYIHEPAEWQSQIEHWILCILINMNLYSSSSSSSFKLLLH